MMHNNSKIFLKLFGIITGFLLYISIGFAGSIPPYIHYQGRLVDQSTGVPINGKKSITFSLYNVPSDGNHIYTQSKEVPLDNGRFSVYLGIGEGYYDGNIIADGIPVEVFTEYSACYLGILIEDSAEEMSPRQLIASAAYAYKAENAIEAELASKAKDAERLMGKVPGEMNGIATLDENSTIPSNQLPGMTVDPSGNVGIGTASPGAKLDVNGNIAVENPQADNHAATKEYVDNKRLNCAIQKTDLGYHSPGTYFYSQGCPNGSVLTGGGCQIQPVDEQDIHGVIYDSYPSENTWGCKFKTNDKGDYLFVYAICCTIN